MQRHPRSGRYRTRLQRIFIALPGAPVLERLADKWTIVIIGRLKSGETRFNQLRRDYRRHHPESIVANAEKARARWLGRSPCVCYGSGYGRVFTDARWTDVGGNVRKFGTLGSIQH